MSPNTARTQVALYLDQGQLKGLEKLAERTGRTKQTLLRLALSMLLAKDVEWIQEHSDSGYAEYLRRKRKP